MGDKAKENIKKLLYYSIGTTLQGLISGIIISILFSLISGSPIISTYSIILVVLITLSSIITGVINFSSYAKPFHEIQLFVKKVSQGDLSYAPNEDELGPLKSIKFPLEYMRKGLQELLGEVQETGKIVQDSSNKLEQRVLETNDNLLSISNELDDLRATINNQLQSAKEVAVTMEEMTIGIGRTSETSNTANESSIQAFELASSGKEKVHVASKQMNSIHLSFGDLDAVMHELISRTGQISEMIADISQIAEQTNLLSLNANIEAARAGEHGKGFSVVAQEVGKLANQTNTSTATITKIIEDIQQKADQALTALSKTNSDVDNGLQSISDLMDSFTNILTSVDHVHSQMHEITSVGQEMAAGSEEVTSSVGDLSNQFSVINTKVNVLTDDIETQAREMDTVMTAAKELNDVSMKLKKLLEKFQIEA